MASIEKFLGKRVEIPEDRHYYTKQGLWAKPDNEEIVFGLSQPALVLLGGLSDLDWLVADGDAVRSGQSVAFAITGKIIYIDSPLEETIQFNPELKQSPDLVMSDPYGKGWLFTIRPDAETEKALQSLADPTAYMDSLGTTEGAKNPDGLKGGVSGICKAVYAGIREQKI